MDLSFASKRKNNYLTLKGIKARQFTHNVISIQCTVNDILKFLEIKREVQREVDHKKISSIKKYIQYGLDGNDIYFPPLIFSARNQGLYDEEVYEYKLSLDERLIILDGQHRIEAFKQLKRTLEARNDNINLEKVNDFPLTIQIYEDLTLDQERQLFTDINSNASVVNNSLLIMYKEGDLYARLVREIVYKHPTIPEDLFETRLRNTRSKLMTAYTLYLVALALNDGAYNRDQRKTINENNFPTYKQNTEDFLTLLRKYAPVDAFDRDKYAIFYPNVMIAIAKYVHECQKRQPNKDMEVFFEKVISKINWSHKNKQFSSLASSYNAKSKKYQFGVRGKTNRLVSEFLLDIYFGRKK
ncbi:DNA sulfur modification protein DndB [Priestia megaterium]|uniref:DNA sulfur modification protein DndB n=1 Tax=Priestia megaterium TaxID=1404 RepID=UPI002E1A7520|nr:DNA sulfur modification protein DndB [Priestia megaterium]